MASNRGPVSFRTSDDGTLTAHQGGAGGLVAGLRTAARDRDLLWVCAALSPADREVAARAPGGRLDRAGHDTGDTAVRMLAIDEATFHRAYNAVANSTLWFVNHLLFNPPRTPSFDQRFAREWQAYVQYNRTFAEALAEEAADGASVLVQDYHLTLAPAMLRELRPDLRIGHFTHTPWAAPSYFSLLPDEVAEQVLRGLLGAHSAGFLSARWAAAFLDCCEQLLDADVDRDAGTVTLDGHLTRVRVHPLGVDREELTSRAAQPDVAGRRAGLLERLAGRRLMLRIDRTELSKNIVRGLHAYRELLERHPEWRGRVVHAVFAYPSRHDLPEYREYTAEVLRVAQEIENAFATPDWNPVMLDVTDDYARSLAAYRLAEVLVVNPVRDGMNLVAKEGPVLAEEGTALVLSREAGAADELGESAFVVNPYDVSATAEAMHAALCLPPDERRARTETLTVAATALPPREWIAGQLAELEETAGS